MKRAGKKSSASYEAYLEALGKTPAPEAPARTARILVATCAGCRRLGRNLGRELALLAVCREGEDKLETLARERHGAGIMRVAEKTPFVEGGWTEWTAIALSHEMSGGRRLPDGVVLEQGSLVVTLPTTTALAEFERRLALQMERQRFDEALTAPAAVKERFERGLALGVEMRFSAPLPQSPATWRRVRDIYVFDPWRDIPAIALRAAAACVESTDCPRERPITNA